MRIAMRLFPYLFSVAGAVLFALFPILIQPDGSSIALRWRESGQALSSYIHGLRTGESFLFDAGRIERSFWHELGSYWWPSFGYTAAAVTFSIAAGLAAAVWLYRYRSVRHTLDALVLVPDFVLIILLQLFVVFFFKSTGILLARIATFSMDRPAVALPLLTMMIIPAIYVMRNLSVHIERELSADYIRTARAKGFGRAPILLRHMLPNVLPYLKADVPKFAAIILGNLFIVEYLYNVRGITKLMLSTGPLQFDLTLNCLLAFMVLYAAVSAIARTIVWLLGRGVKR